MIIWMLETTYVIRVVCDNNNGLYRMMTSECWSVFVCWLLHAQHNNLANIVFACLIHVIMKVQMK